ncbi:hypothetical protein [Pontibacter sp. G13]|uniref:hypothetical protein n=1 Tax=Pontibacter sp. G13 TaxID=3074898 RepID=UPI00288A7057|nr:hypothetical protein [Pontibacter sp. G13]WNJ18350.1 hypothetical protein RJD25_26145 [Pontibacter sp. G13]
MMDLFANFWEYLPTGLIVFFVMFVISRLSKASLQTVSPDAHGQFHLRRPRILFVGGILAVGVSLMVGVLIGIMLGIGPEMLFLSALYLAISIWGWTLIRSYRNSTLQFNSEVFSYQNARGYSEEMAWKDVQKVSYNRFLGHLEMSTANESLSFPTSFEGFGSFLEMMEAQTSFMRGDIGLPVLFVSKT